jgi:hypothetical protein
MAAQTMVSATARGHTMRRKGWVTPGIAPRKRISLGEGLSALILLKYYSIDIIFITMNTTITMTVFDEREEDTFSR